MQDLVEFLVKRIVNNPDKVTISENVDEMDNTIITIEADQEDKPILIGKGGRNITAVRELVKIIARKSNKRVYIKISD